MVNRAARARRDYDSAIQDFLALLELPDTHADRVATVLSEHLACAAHLGITAQRVITHLEEANVCRRTL